MKLHRLFSALTAAVMSVSTIPLRVLADGDIPLRIDTVSLSGAVTALIRGEKPLYAMQLSDACAAQMEITEEMWNDAFDNTVVFTRSGGETVPLNDQSAYRYAVMLHAKDGYYFPDSFSLIYDGEPVDADAYSYEGFGTTLLLYCGFLPLTESTDGPPVLYGDLNDNGDINIGDAVLLMRLLNEDKEVPLSDTGFLAADFNCDGALTMQDAKDMLLYLAGQSVQSDLMLSDEFGAFELPQPTEVCTALQEGNSLEFASNPLPGLTISAPENALSYDGQLQTAPLTEEKTQELTEQFKQYGIIMAAGWEIRAGLEPDEHLPGYYHSEFDLTSIELPEELYDSVRVMRVDDNGAIHRYVTEVEGSTVKWDSDQNSFVILGIIAVGVAVAAQFSGMTIAAIYTVQIIAALVAGAVTYWEFSRGEAVKLEAEMYVNRMRFYETKHFTIWYALGQTADDGHKARVAAREKAIEDRASQEVLEEIGDSGQANSPKYIYEVEVRKRKYLAEDAEYQAMLTEVERVPADVRLLAHQLETAYDYLDEQNAGELVNHSNKSYKPDVLFSPSSSALGLAVTPTSGADPYLIFERSRALVDDPLLIPESAGVMDYYGTVIDAARADNLLITATHEIFHIHQNKYYSGTDIAHLKFSEFSAMVLQNHCAEYYGKYGPTSTVYSEHIDTYYETYAVPFDEVLGEKEGQSQGYTLSHFFLYLERTTGQKHTALEFVEQYKKQNFNTAKALSNLFGFGDDLEKLAKYWRGFLASYADIIGGAAYFIRNYSGTNEQGYMERQHRIRINSANESVKVNVDAKDFTATEVLIYGPDGDKKTGTWQALIVKDESCKENLKDFGFVFPRNQQRQYVAARTRNGAAVCPKNDVYPFIERQGFGNTGSGSYTVYLLSEPDEPELRYDEETGEIVVKVKMPDTATARDRATDCMRLNVYVSDQLCAIRNIRYEDLAEEIRIAAYELCIPLNREVTVSATVCESVTGDADSLTFFGPRSFKARLTVERTAETTTARTETTAETTVTETVSDTGAEITDVPPQDTDYTDLHTELNTDSHIEPHTDPYTDVHTEQNTEPDTTEPETDTPETVTTETEKPEFPILHYQFDYMEGEGTRNTKSETQGVTYEADFGGISWTAHDHKEYYRITAKPANFELFRDGSFRLQISGHSGKDPLYNDDGTLKGYWTWDYDGFTLYGNIRQSIDGLDEWEAEINDCSVPFFDFQETNPLGHQWIFKDSFQSGTLRYSEYEGYPELYADITTSDGQIQFSCSWRSLLHW